MTQQLCTQNFCQTAADRNMVRLLLTVYRNSLSPYLSVPSPTLYGVRFDHNACVTKDDRQTT